MSPSSAEKQRQALESEGKEALWLYMGYTTRSLIGWAFEQIKRRPWWFWVLLLI
jgi:hypothetical protein